MKNIDNYNVLDQKLVLLIGRLYCTLI